MRKKGLALVSGGLDSTLAIKVMLDQDIDMEAVHFTSPFCNCDFCSVNEIGSHFGVLIHHISLGQEFLDLLVNPPHGYGSQMNICIDCRILMLKKAKELGEKMGVDFYVTGEVLGQRPFSQKRRAMLLIEKESGLEGKILRPLSAKILEETYLEKEGHIDREQLYSISGRRRIPQINLAEKLGVYNYPCPSGGCLLTDPHFSKRLRDYIEHEGRPVLEDMILLRIGRHFRIGKTRIIVGRNESENNKLEAQANRRAIPKLSVLDYMGPITLIKGNIDKNILDLSASITVRYSDAPKKTPVKVVFNNGTIKHISTSALPDEEINKLRI